MPAVLNTAFTVDGQRIVANPFDAISTLFGMGMDYPGIGNYIVGK